MVLLLSAFPRSAKAWAKRVTASIEMWACYLRSLSNDERKWQIYSDCAVSARSQIEW
jgi:hypothetical protein